MQSSQVLARTQIYLTQQQQRRLALASQRAAVTKSEIIRMAIDQFLGQKVGALGAQNQAGRFAGLSGLWADRADMADPAAFVNALRQPRF